MEVLRGVMNIAPRLGDREGVCRLSGTNVRVQLVLPGAVVSEGWDVAGVSLDTIDPATVMTTEDCVDAALSGLDRGEVITVPSLQDEALLRNFEAAAGALLQAVFESGKPATRYGLK